MCIKLDVSSLTPVALQLEVLGHSIDVEVGAARVWAVFLVVVKQLPAGGASAW